MAIDINGKFRQVGRLAREAAVSDSRAEKIKRKQDNARAKILARKSACMLRNIDRIEAQPLVAAIRYAERANGQRLMIGVRPGLAITGRGLRLVRTFVPQRDDHSLTDFSGPVVVWPEWMTFRLKSQWVNRYLRNHDAATLGADVRAFLSKDGLENQLVFAGADEWPATWLTRPLYVIASFGALCSVILLPLTLIAPAVANSQNKRAYIPLRF